jgi:hypothetical protein
MASMPSPKPPAKPDVKATRKALLAYHSELQKYHEKLTQWENLIDQRNEDLIKMREEFEEMVEAEGYGWDGEDDDFEEDEECECTAEDAMSGCPCDGCEEYRVNRRKQVQSVIDKPVGDEVEFLEKMFSLKDTRRKSRKDTKTSA